MTAVVLPVLLLLGFEGALRLTGYGRPAGFLIPDEKPGWFRTNPDFVGFFLPRNFELRPLNFRIPEKKPAGALRVVVLGESAAQGVPAPPFGFAPQLRAQLRTRYPGREIEVINTGIVAVNSHVVLQAAKDLAGFSPDLFVVYLGNNEVVGPYGPGSAYLAQMPPRWLIRLSIAAKMSRTGQLLAALEDRLPRRRGPRLEWGGMAMFVNNAVRGDDPRLEAVYQNFAANLRDIVRVAAGAGAKTVLCTVAANLRDSAPFLSLHQPGLADANLAAWREAFDRGHVEWLLGEDAAAQRDLETARKLDPQFADTSFLLGTLAAKAGDTTAARRLLGDALHWDALRFRPDPRLNTIIRDVSAEGIAGVSLVDAARELGADPESTAPIAGRGLFFEHVHFDWDGNYRMGRLLAAGVETALGGAPAPAGAWLDSAGSAAALAYTDHARLGVLHHIAAIVRNPPFTNQLTYFEDQARLAGEIARVELAAKDPAGLRQAKAVAVAAIAADPANPDLAEIAEAIAMEQEDLPAALAAARRAADLLPVDAKSVADEASLLGEQGKFDEARQVLRKGGARLPDAGRLAPARAALATRMKQFAEGRGYLDAAIQRAPEDTTYRLMRGNLARITGDNDAAEADFRGVLRTHPDNEPALEGLVGLLVHLGQPKAAEQASLEFAEAQTRNQLNNLLVAQLEEVRGDAAQAVKFLLAAERSGPVGTPVEVSLARKLHQLGRAGESLLHLARARRLSLLEGDPEITRDLDDTIARLRSEKRREVDNQ